MCAKNGKITLKFVEVIHGRLYRSFFPDTVYIEPIGLCSSCCCCCWYRYSLPGRRFNVGR